MKKLYLNSNHNEITWNKRNYLLEAAKRLGWEDDVVIYDHRIHSDAEYVLNIEPWGVFATGSKWTGIWEIDVMFDRAQMSLSDWIASDTVFIANNNLPDRMQAYQGERITMFQACDPVLHRRLPEIKQEYDFVFCGTMGLEVYRGRELAVQKLRDEGFTFCSFPKGVSPQEYVKSINHAKVQFIRSADKPPIGAHQVEQRFFECLAIGPVLKDYHSDLEILGLEEGVDFFWYKNEQEMVEKMHYLIDNPDFAKQMAENGRKKALMFHTYEHRLITIMKIIEEHE